MNTCPPVNLVRTSPHAPLVAAMRADAGPARRRVAEVLRTVLPGRVSHWEVQTLASGRQAQLFSCRPQRGTPPPRGNEFADDLIVKLYGAQGPAAEAAAGDEYECLRRLHARLDGTMHDGWTVQTPRPLRLCACAGAIVMTRVPGEPLSRHLASGEGPPRDVLASVARATTSCLRRYWEGEPRLYGDLILDNILCDLPSRTLSLVDPGLPEPFYTCDAAARSWYPASRDLGFLLFWTASLVRQSLARPVLHARRQRMTRLILRAFLEGLASAAERDEAAAEIEACARLHLSRLGESASPKGLWQRIVKRAAATTVDRILRDLRETPSVGPGQEGSTC